MLDKFLNKILQGDCLTLLSQIPDNSVDIAFADPPFNLGKKYNSAKDALAVQEYLQWCEKKKVPYRHKTKASSQKTHQK